MVYFVDDIGPSPVAQSVAFRDLPLRDVGQHPVFSSIYLKKKLYYFSWASFLEGFLISTYFQVLFISERMVVAVGYDCNPMVFTADERGIWYSSHFLVIH